jgi:hypothetical protein
MRIISINSIAIAFIFLLQILSCDAQQSKSNKVDTKSDKIEAYYFHFTARCYTCRNVEAKAKESIETLYPELIQKGKISFQSINLDDESSKALAEKLNVYGQTLLIVKGDKKVNLTNEGFMYANSDPEKLKSIIKAKVDELLKM